MERAVYSLVFFLMAVIQKLPAWACARTGSFFGLVAWCILPKYRNLVERNLRIAFPEKSREIRSLGRKHFQVLGANLMGAAHFFAADEAEVRAHTTMENLGELQAAYARGRGVVLAISHIGNWEMFAQACFYAREMPFGTVFQKVHNRYIDSEITRLRQRLGVKTFDRKTEMGAAASFLKSGGVLGILVDQHAGESGIWTPLFGKLASTSPLAASLAIKTGAAVVPVAIFTDGVGRWRISVRKEVSHDGNGVESLTAGINRALEEQIRESPADWFWVHNRWKLPMPEFLLGRAKRGIYLPGDAQTLQKLRVVVRGSNWLGDAVMNVPAVRALKAGRPDLHLSVLTPEKLADLWKWVDAVDEVIAIPEGASVFRVARELKKRNFDAGILFPNSLRVALELFLAGIPRRVGFPGHRRSWLLNQIPKGRKGRMALMRPEHQSRHYSLLVERLGAPQLSEPLAQGREKIAEMRFGICPSAEYGSAKRWPAENYRAVMDAVSSATPCQWRVFGTKKDSAIAADLLRGFSGDAVDLTGKTTMAELMQELSQLRFLLTNDTGTMHLAAMLGIPVVAIFGSTEPLLTGPIGSGHVILRKQVECSPCFRRECPLDFRCMTEVKPEDATRGIYEILARQ